MNLSTTVEEISATPMASADAHLSAEPTPATVSTVNFHFIVYLLVTITMSVWGTIGNLLVLGALLVHKRLRVLSNVFVGNLAIADLCVSIIINPFSVVGVLYGNFFAKYPSVCETVGALCVISCSCSVWSIAAISLNRYAAICHRLTYHSIYNHKTVPFIVASLWIFCFIVDLPNFIGWGRHAFDTRAFYCAYDYTANYGYTLYAILLGFFFPMTLVSYCYLRIFMFARRSKQRLKDLTKADRHTQNQIKTTDMRLLKSIGSIWIMFMTMWTPYATIVLFDFSGNWPQWYFVLSIALAHTNSSINSVLYAATNKNFREGYIILIKRVLCCIAKQQYYNKDSRASTVANSQLQDDGIEVKNVQGQNNDIVDKVEEKVPEQSDDIVDMVEEKVLEQNDDIDKEKVQKRNVDIKEKKLDELTDDIDKKKVQQRNNGVGIAKEQVQIGDTEERKVQNDDI